MKLIYGARSSFPSNTRLTNGYNLYEWVMRMSCYPSFWGRNISGERAIQVEEIKFLRSKECKIALLFNAFTENEIAGNKGVEAALRAVEAVKALGVPPKKGIAIFADIPSEWSVNHNWMISFSRSLIRNGYRPGFIGNTDSSKNFNFGRQCSHYVQATRKEDQLGAVYWSTEPQYPFDPEIWATYAPSQLLPRDMALWQYGTVNFHNIFAGKCYARDSSVTECFWKG